MQQIERYGVIALLFLLVTIVVVALWDGGEGAQAAERLSQAQAQADTPTVKTPVRTNTNRRARPAAEQDRRTRVTLSGQDRGKTEAERQRQEWNRRTRPVVANPRPNQPTAGALANYHPAAAGNQTTRLNGYQSEQARRHNTTQYPANRTEGRIIHAVPEGRNQATKVVQPTIAPSGLTYKIRPGDTLERIARNQLGDGKRWREIQTLNQISVPDRIVVGAVLKLPAGAVAQQAPSKKSKAVQPSGTRNGIYVVQSGDVLSRIAQKELGSAKRYTEILALNPKVKANRLRVGTKLKMPGAAAAIKTVGKPQGRSVAKATPKNSAYVVH